MCLQALDASPALTVTEKMFLDIEKRNQEGQTGGAGGSTTIDALRRTDSIWEKIRSNDTQNIVNFVSEASSDLPKQPEFDVTVCGGTLGIFLATSLQLKGLSVCVIERGRLAGRAQEWNISRSELDALVHLGVLTDEEIEEAVAVNFNPVRMQFKARFLTPIALNMLPVHDIIVLYRWAPQTVAVGFIIKPVKSASWLVGSGASSLHCLHGSIL